MSIRSTIWVWQRRPGMVGEFLKESLVQRLRSFGNDVMISENPPPRDKSRKCLAIIADSLNKSELVQLRERHKNAKILFADPKIANRDDIETIQGCDLALVASIELKTMLESMGVESLMVYWVPELDHITQGARRERVIAYHGNKVHLMAMGSTTLAALDDFNSSQESNPRLVLECHYNIEKLGPWKPPKSETLIRHRQFSSPETWESIATATIGIVPNLLPSPNDSHAWRGWRKGRKRTKPRRNPLLLREDDLFLRYKINTNAARIYPFAFFKVPVIADISASMTEFIQHRVTGLLCWNRDSWSAAIAAATQNESLMRSYAELLHGRVISEMHPQASAKRLDKWVLENCQH